MYVWVFSGVGFVGSNFLELLKGLSIRKVKEISGELLSGILGRESGRTEEDALLKKLGRGADNDIRATTKEGARAIVDMQRSVRASGGGLTDYAKQVLTETGDQTSKLEEAHKLSKFLLLHSKFICYFPSTQEVLN